MIQLSIAASILAGLVCLCIEIMLNGRSLSKMIERIDFVGTLNPWLGSNAQAAVRQAVHLMYLQ